MCDIQLPEPTSILPRTLGPLRHSKHPSPHHHHHSMTRSKDRLSVVSIRKLYYFLLAERGTRYFPISSDVNSSLELCSPREVPIQGRRSCATVGCDCDKTKGLLLLHTFQAKSHITHTHTLHTDTQPWSLESLGFFSEHPSTTCTYN